MAETSAADAPEAITLRQGILAPFFRAAVWRRILRHGRHNLVFFTSAKGDLG